MSKFKPNQTINPSTPALPCAEGAYWAFLPIGRHYDAYCHIRFDTSHRSLRYMHIPGSPCFRGRGPPAPWRSLSYKKPTHFFLSFFRPFVSRVSMPLPQVDLPKRDQIILSRRALQKRCLMNWIDRYAQGDTELLPEEFLKDHGVTTIGMNRWLRSTTFQKAVRETIVGKANVGGLTLLHSLLKEAEEPDGMTPKERMELLDKTQKITGGFYEKKDESDAPGVAIQINLPEQAYLKPEVHVRKAEESFGDLLQR